MMDKLIAMRNSKKKGFTLIELIAVIAILAILAALAVPAYNGLKKSAAEQVAASNVRSVYTAYRASETMKKNGDAKPTAQEVGKMLSEGASETDTLAGGKIAIVTKGGDGADKDAVTGVSWSGTINGYSLVATYTFGAADPISVADKE